MARRKISPQKLQRLRTNRDQELERRRALPWYKRMYLWYVSPVIDPDITLTKELLDHSGKSLLATWVMMFSYQFAISPTVAVVRPVGAVIWDWLQHGWFRLLATFGLVSAGTILYTIRFYFRRVYGAMELTVGVLVCSGAVNQLSGTHDPLIWMTILASSTFLIVRGLDNYQQEREIIRKNREERHSEEKIAVS